MYDIAMLPPCQIGGAFVDEDLKRHQSQKDMHGILIGSG